MKLLLVEDEKRMAQALAELLRLENYEVDVCRDGLSGLEAATGNLYDIVILDVMLPGIDGFELVKSLRKQNIRTPVLMLTAKSGLEDTVTGLDSGADDYLTKPFLTEELLARLRALIRRNIHSDDGTLSFGDIALETGVSSLICTATGQSVRLSEKEYRILEYLIANQGRILTREQLAVKIWGFDSDAEYNNVEVYLSFTRRKLAFIGAKTTIKALRGIGYELRYSDV
ncbi:MAG: response regulator transcription factor [Lachnospiraceae bacterium]|nr:response regulator transcription factor [Lachnospiraceae bacterium]